MKIDHLEKKIDGRTILRNIHLTIKKGEITGLIGRNGSGKTTFFRSIASHYQLDKGRILIGEQDIRTTPLLKQKIFYIDDQYNFLASYSLKKLQTFYQNAYPTFDNTKYTNFLAKHSLHPQVKFSSLSKGKQGLYKMILALSSHADYLLLDEPFDGLDAIVKKSVIDMLLEDISEQKQAVLISSHNLDELESIIDRALLLKDQELCYDFYLEALREQACKLQIVFKKKEIPPIIEEESQWFYTQGRVITAIFEHYSEKIERLIQAEKPLLFEEIPLTLEDIFKAKLSEAAHNNSFQGGV